MYTHTHTHTAARSVMLRYTPEHLAPSVNTIKVKSSVLLCKKFKTVSFHFSNTSETETLQPLNLNPDGVSETESRSGIRAEGDRCTQVCHHRVFSRNEAASL